jgi:hypothetical protein
MAQTPRLLLRAASEERGDAAGIESLSEQVAVDPPEDGGITQRHSVAQAAIQCVLQQLVFIDVAEDFRHGLASEIAVDTERLNVPHNARAAAMFDLQLCSCACNRRAAIVNGLFIAKACHRRVNVVWLEFAAREPLAELRFGEFAAGEKRQAGDIRLLCPSGHQCVAGVSGAM